MDHEERVQTKLDELVTAALASVESYRDLNLDLTCGIVRIDGHHYDLTDALVWMALHPTDPGVQVVLGDVALQLRRLAANELEFSTRAQIEKEDCYVQAEVDHLCDFDRAAA